MNPEVRLKYDSYPPHVRTRMLALRALILDTASEISDVGTIEETLKWSEPAYVSKIGSTIRIDWKERNPDQYAIYFNCNSKLVEIFAQLYGGVLHLEGNRAILLDMNAEIPVDVLRHCISLALTYHKVKHLPLLGAVRSPMT